MKGGLLYINTWNVSGFSRHFWEEEFRDPKKNTTIYFGWRNSQDLVEKWGICLYISLFEHQEVSISAVKSLRFAVLKLEKSHESTYSIPTLTLSGEIPWWNCIKKPYRFGGTNCCHPQKKTCYQNDLNWKTSGHNSPGRWICFSCFCSPTPSYRAQSLCDSVGLSVHFLGKTAATMWRWKAAPPQQQKTKQKKGHFKRVSLYRYLPLFSCVFFVCWVWT